MKFNIKGEFEVTYSPLKPLSQNFKVFTPRGDVINRKMSPNWYFMYQCSFKDENQK